MFCIARCEINYLTLLWSEFGHGCCATQHFCTWTPNIHISKKNIKFHSQFVGFHVDLGLLSLKIGYPKILWSINVLSRGNCLEKGHLLYLCLRKPIWFKSSAMVKRWIYFCYEDSNLSIARFDPEILLTANANERRKTNRKNEELYKTKTFVGCYIVPYSTYNICIYMILYIHVCIDISFYWYVLSVSKGLSAFKIVVWFMSAESAKKILTSSDGAQETPDGSILNTRVAPRSGC